MRPRLIFTQCLCVRFKRFKLLSSLNYTPRTPTAHSRTRFVARAPSTANNSSSLAVSGRCEKSRRTQRVRTTKKFQLVSPSAIRLLRRRVCQLERNPRTQLVTLGRPRVGARSVAVVRSIELGEVGVVSPLFSCWRRQTAPLHSSSGVWCDDASRRQKRACFASRRKKQARLEAETSPAYATGPPEAGTRYPALPCVGGAAPIAPQSPPQRIPLKEFLSCTPRASPPSFLCSSASQLRSSR